MDFIIELLLELLLEGSLELGSNKKVNLWIRIPLLIFVCLFFLSVTGLLFFLGIAILKDNYLAGFFVIGITIFLVIGLLLKFRKVYKKMNN